MAKKAIPDEIRQEVKEIIERFNETELNSDSENVIEVNICILIAQVMDEQRKFVV